MDWSVIVTGLFGLFNIIGGFIGYKKAGSKASLIAGSISGIILLICSYGISNDNEIAVIGALLVAVLLGVRFLGTWLKTRRMMPDLLMVLFSLATLFTVCLEFFRS